MRTVLMLLVLCVSVGVGQDLTDEQKWEMDTAKGTPISWFARDSLLVWWSQYKAECYADSADNWERLPEPIVTRVGSGLAPDGHTTITYSRYAGQIHRTPTFDGFMDFLNRKR